MTILSQTTRPEIKLPSELNIFDLSRESTPTYNPLVSLPSCDFYEECATAQRLLELKEIIGNRDIQEIKQELSHALPTEKPHSLQLLLDEYREICPKNLSPHRLPEQLLEDLTHLQIRFVQKRSTLGVTAGVYFIESHKAINFVLKYIPQAEAIANERYRILLEAVKDPHLKMPAWEVLRSDCPLNLGPIPETYRHNNCKTCVFATAPGMPIGSFIVHCYQSLTFQQQKQFFTLIAKIALLDAFIGNCDRLYKIGRTASSNLGNLLVQPIDENNKELKIFLIDNSSNLQKNIFPPNKYATQQRNFFHQIIDQIVSALPNYCKETSIPLAQEELQSLQNTFKEDAFKMEDEMISMWHASLKHFARQINLVSPGPLDKLISKQLKRTLGSNSKPPTPETPNKTALAIPTSPFLLDIGTPDHTSAGPEAKTIFCWVNALQQLAKSNGAPENPAKLRKLASAAIPLSPETQEVSSLVRFVTNMSKEQQIYHPALPQYGTVARKELRHSRAPTKKR